MKTEIIRADHPVVLKHAMDVLKNGGLVAFPTDTIYGLAANIFNAETVERLNVVKGRASERTIAAMIADFTEIRQVVSSISPYATRLAENFWPGSLTLVLPARTGLSPYVAPKGTIGVRIPASPLALALLRQSGPLAVTSANRYGQPLPVVAQDVLTQLNGLVHLVIDGGEVSGKIPSTIIDCTGAEPELLRAGPIAFDELKAFLFNTPSIY